MTTTTFKPKISWTCKNTWKKASYNTSWCLLGCAIGDLGTIAFFQYTGIPWPPLLIFSLAIINGLITSIILETIILCRQMSFADALKTSLGMSLISMISMEISMNLVDYILVGEAKLVLWVVPMDRKWLSSQIFTWKFLQAWSFLEVLD